MLTKKNKYTIHNPYDFNLSISFINFVNEQLNLFKSEDNQRNLIELSKIELYEFLFRKENELNFLNSLLSLKKIFQNDYDIIKKEFNNKTKIQNKKTKELQKKIDLIVNEEQKKRDNILSNQLDKSQEFHAVFKKSRTDAIKKEKTRINSFNDNLKKLIENESKVRFRILNDFNKSLNFDFIEFYTKTAIIFLAKFKNIHKVDLKPEITTSMDFIYLSLLSFIDRFSRFKNIGLVNFNDIIVFNEAAWTIKTCQEKILQIVDNNVYPLKKIDYSPILNFIKEHLIIKFNHDKIPEEIREKFTSYLEVCHWIIHRHAIVQKDPKYFLDKIRIPELINELENDIYNIYITKSLKTSVKCNEKIVHILSNLISAIATFHQRLKIQGRAKGEHVWTQYFTEGVEYGCNYQNPPQLLLKALIIAACEDGTELALQVYLKKARELNMDLNKKFDNFDSTARDLAVKNGHTNIARLLIEYNVDTEMKQENRRKNKL